MACMNFVQLRKRKNLPFLFCPTFSLFFFAQLTTFYCDTSLSPNSTFICRDLYKISKHLISSYLGTCCHLFWNFFQLFAEMILRKALVSKAWSHFGRRVRGCVSTSLCCRLLHVQVYENAPMPGACTWHVSHIAMYIGQHCMFKQFNII